MMSLHAAAIPSAVSKFGSSFPRHRSAAQGCFTPIFHASSNISLTSGAETFARPLFPGSFQMFQKRTRSSSLYFSITSPHISKNFGRSAGSSALI